MGFQFTFVLFNRELSEKAPEFLEVVLPKGESEIWLSFEDHQDMSHLAVLCGLFTSTSQARKNNWLGPVPSGYTERKHGKSKFIAIVNKIPNWDNPDYWSSL